MPLPAAYRRHITRHINNVKGEKAAARNAPTVDMNTDIEPDALVNRDDPIPILRVSADSPSPQDPSTPRPRSRSPSHLVKHTMEKAASSSSSSSIQDRLFSAMFQQILPHAPSDDGGKPDRRSRKYVGRPNFSVGRMSKNFRSFNSRIGVVFVFQNRLIRLFSWRNPTHTLSFLAAYSFVCLDPNLLAALPLIVCLFFIMVPAYIVRHPPPTGATPNEAFSIRGPASAMPKGIKPAPEMSKDFFRNMRDLQNSMEDFSVVHDRLVALIAPLTNFSDESLSSLVFLILFFTSCLLFLFSGLVPWRQAFMVGGWTVIGSLHPFVAANLASRRHDDIKAKGVSASKDSWAWARGDIVMDEPPEVRDVEVFELQRHRAGSEWEPWVYSTLPYTPLSPRRIAGERPQGSRWFEDVQPPQGWDWKDKKWTLDLLSKEWVEERMITAVEIETEGERWVYDISQDDGGNGGYEHGKQDWEESASLGSKGEWRRRRWVRLVQRKVVE